MAKAVNIRFYAQLSDFISKLRNKEVFTFHYYGNPTVKDTIEGLGVPHTEVGLIIINGRPRSFDYHLIDGDFISVFPEFENIRLPAGLSLQPIKPRDLRFILDAHLGKLAKYLRLAGFDSLFSGSYPDPEIIKLSNLENRIILTRDRDLLKNKLTKWGYWVRLEDPRKQFEEVVNKFSLVQFLKPFSRCLICNGQINPVPKENVLDLISEKEVKYFSKFFQCQSCEKVYWKGSHYKRMEEFMLNFVKHF